MAGLSLAWFDAVTHSIKIYIMLVISSSILAYSWKVLALPTVLPQTFALHFYQHVVGVLDGRSCPSYPVCSVYARQALQQHGWLVGSWLTMDRLIHEGDDVHLGPFVRFDGEIRLNDPLKRNDFWLKGESL